MMEEDKTHFAEGKTSSPRRFLRNKWLWAAVLAAVVLGGIVYAVLSLTRGTELTEQDAWNRVTQFQAAAQLDSLDAALDAYLWTYTDGRYAEDARTLRDRLRNERDRFERIADDGYDTERAVQALDAYLEEYPDGFYRRDALRLQDSLEFVLALEAQTEDALLDYLEQHPDSRFAEAAHEALKRVGKQAASEEEAKLASDCIRNHFEAMQLYDEEGLVATLSDVISSYIGKPNPLHEDIIAYMEHFHKGQDDKRLTASNFDVQKMLNPDGTLYNVQFDLTETINPKDTAKTVVRQLKGTAILDPAMRISSLVLRGEKKVKSEK